MTSNIEAVNPRVGQSTPEERIWDGLDKPDASLDAPWAKEADGRLAAYRRDKARAVALSEVIA